METAEILSRRDTIIDKPELSNLKVLYYINMFLLITDYLMPQYFGIDIGYDITCTRFANIIVIIYVICNQNILKVFTKNCIKHIFTIPLMAYLFVATYTMFFRADINAFMLVFLEVLTFYMLFFGIRFVIGCRKGFKIIIFCAYFLCIYGVVEYVVGHSLYLQFLRTVQTRVVNCYRSGRYRIMGPCGHPLGYGLLLLIFNAFASIDFDNNKIDVFKRPFLILLLFVNVFLTGSRSTLAISILEFFLLFIFSEKEKRKKALIVLLGVVFGLAFFIIVTFKTSIGRYVLMQITSVIDLAFDTQLAAKYGADVDTLQNSEEYREFLPLIFTLDWLNPFVGRGVKQNFGAEFEAADGTMKYMHSIDNYYVSQYIKYAYPGMISYIVFILGTAYKMIKEIIKKKSGVLKGLFIGFICYFFNLWWLDALQTLKFVYVLVALFFSIAVSIDKIYEMEEKSPECK